MKFYAKVYSTDTHFEENTCEYAVIDIPPGLAKLIMERATAINKMMQMAELSDLGCVEFYSYHVEYYPWSAFEKHEDLLEKLDDVNIVDASDYNVDLEGVEEERVDCERMVISWDSARKQCAVVHWEAYPKHMESVKLSTPEILLDKVVQIIETEGQNDGQDPSANSNPG